MTAPSPKRAERSDATVAVPGESAKWAQHLIRLARLVRGSGDVQMVTIEDDGVEQTWPLSGQLVIVALNLDYDAVMAMPPEPGPDDAPLPAAPVSGGESVDRLRQAAAQMRALAEDAAYPAAALAVADWLDATADEWPREATPVVRAALAVADDFLNPATAGPRRSKES